MSAPKKINLLPKEGFEYTPLGKVLSWALSAGRVIVIFTELVVIIAFLSRFFLDRTLSDLNEENTNKRLRVESQASFEKEFRNTQLRLALYKKLTDSASLSSFVSELANLLPSGVVLTKISLDKNELLVSGDATTEGGIAGTVKGLSTLSRVKKANLADIRLDPSKQSISFTIRGELQ